MFYQILLSPQVKWSVIISNKYVKYELPHELPNDPMPTQEKKNFRKPGP